MKGNGENMTNKHLYAVDLTEDKENERVDENPFVTGRLSENTRQTKKAEGKNLTKLLAKELGLGRMIAGIVLAGLGALILSVTLELISEEGLSPAMQNAWWLVAIGVVSLIAGVILLILHRVRAKKKADELDEDAELTAFSEKMEGFSDRVNLELNLPADEDMTEMDILSYRYKRTAKGEKEILENGVYMNDSVYLHREGDNLLLTDYDTVMTIPVSAFEGYYTVDAKYKIFIWFKDEEPDEGRYAAYHIKEDSNVNYSLKTYYRVMISDGIDRYELRVPCYDLEVLLGLVDIPCLDGRETA